VIFIPGWRAKRAAHGPFHDQRKKPCQPISNLSMKLEKNENMMNEFIQPDVAVYCERPKKIISGYKGQPLIVIEVVNPSTYKIDVTLKKDLYCAYGVEEYWIAVPYNKTTRQCTLEHDRYAETIIRSSERLTPRSCSKACRRQGMP